MRKKITMHLEVYTGEPPSTTSMPHSNMEHRSAATESKWFLIGDALETPTDRYPNPKEEAAHHEIDENYCPDMLPPDFLHRFRPTISRVGIHSVAIHDRNHHLPLSLPTLLLLHFLVLVGVRGPRASGRRRKARARRGRLLVLGGNRLHETAELREEVLLEAEVGEGIGSIASDGSAASADGRGREGVAEAAEEEECPGLAEDGLVGDGEENEGFGHEEGVDPATGCVGVMAVESRHCREATGGVPQWEIIIAAAGFGG